MAAHLLRCDGLFLGSSAAMNCVGAVKARPVPPPARRACRPVGRGRCSLLPGPSALCGRCGCRFVLPGIGEHPQ